MSDWLKQEQQGLVNDNHGSSNENKDRKQAELPIQETAVTVNLVDCMKCVVRIPRCQIEEQNNGWKTDAKMIIEQQIRERYEEEEK